MCTVKQQEASGMASLAVQDSHVYYAISASRVHLLVVQQSTAYYAVVV